MPATFLTNKTQYLFNIYRTPAIHISASALLSANPQSSLLMVYCTSFYSRLVISLTLFRDLLAAGLINFYIGIISNLAMPVGRVSSLAFLLAITTRSTNQPRHKEHASSTSLGSSYPTKIKRQDPDCNAVATTTAITIIQ